jgi:hypothetical protein
MLRATTGFVVLTFACFAMGCESETQPPDETSIVPPSPIDGAPAGDGSGVMFAVTRFDLGEGHGYDLDAAITRGAFAGHCQAPPDVSPSDVFEDGEGGVDNAFGKRLLPILSFLEEGPVDPVEDTLGRGSDGLLIHLRDLGAATEYGSISAFAYGLRTDEAAGPWLLSPHSVAEPAAGDIEAVLASGLTRFSESYVSRNEWVGRGSDGVVELSWLFDGEPLVLRVHRPIVTLELSEAHDGSPRGVLAGVLDVDETTTALRDWLGRSSHSLCEGGALEGLLRQVEDSADIMKDGTQDPSASCDGISFGVGFQATAVEVTEVGPPRALAEACPAPE